MLISRIFDTEFLRRVNLSNELGSNNLVAYSYSCLRLASIAEDSSVKDRLEADTNSSHYGTVMVSLNPNDRLRTARNVWQA